MQYLFLSFSYLIERGPLRLQQLFDLQPRLLQKLLGVVCTLLLLVDKRLRNAVVVLARQGKERSKEGIKS
jgi:hypothetical protein